VIIMTNRLGGLIGMVKHTFSNTNASGAKCQLTVNIDFTNTSDIDIRSWLCSNRVIAFARPLSKLSLDEMMELDGETFNASTIGQKVLTKHERMLADLFNKVKNNPDKLAQLNELLDDDTTGNDDDDDDEIDE
jgi:hypothetical protein